MRPDGGLSGSASVPSAQPKREQARSRLFKREQSAPAVLPPSTSGNVIPYLRVSTLGQDTGLEVQWERIASWARFEGIELDVTRAFVDKVSGASTDNRPGYRAALKSALESAASGRATVVVYKLDRLGRNALDVQEALAVLLDAGVRVVAVADGIDSASGMGEAVLKLLVSLMAALAEMERESIRVRLLDGRRRASAAGRPYASEPAYGRQVGDDGLLHDDPGELAAVELIRRLHGQGVSVRAIIVALVANGLRPRRAEKWSTAVVHRIAKGRREKKVTRRTRLDRARAELLGNANSLPGRRGPGSGAAPRAGAGGRAGTTGDEGGASRGAKGPAAPRSAETSRRRS